MLAIFLGIDFFIKLCFPCENLTISVGFTSTYTRVYLLVTNTYNANMNVGNISLLYFPIEILLRSGLGYV